jgi:hypothetical protein
MAKVGDHERFAGVKLLSELTGADARDSQIVE